MKKEIFVVILIVLIVGVAIGILYFIKLNNKNKNNNINIQDLNNKDDDNPYLKYNFYKEDNLKRYKTYYNDHSNLSFKDIVIRVNIGLDHEFYTNTKEVTEYSLNMLVNKYHYVNSTYIPSDLVDLTEYTVAGMQMVNEAKVAFTKMAKDAESEGYKIRAISTYRSYSFQKDLYNSYVKNDSKERADTYSARPGYSEHNTGLAVDVDNITKIYTNFGTTEEYKWMQKNAYKYGFIQRYTEENKDITGYIVEEWHYRYIGIEIATYMYNNKINSYEEYYYEFIDK